MNRNLLALAILSCPLSAIADDRTPEQLLPATTQAYARWDGIAAHREAYAKSARGKMFAGETGKAAAALMSAFEKRVKMIFVGDALLGGEQAEVVQKARDELKAAMRLPNLLAETGLVAGFELRPPVYDFKALSGIVRGDPNVRERLLEPQFQLTIVVPGGAEKPEIVAVLRLLMQMAASSVKEQTILERKVVWFEAAPAKPILAAWAEGKHLVVAMANQPVEKMVAKVKEAGAGVTGSPLYKKLGAFKEFRVVTRGFVDVGAAISSFEKLATAAAPGAWAIVEELGLTGIKSACFWDGFEGEESRGVFEIDYAGPRRGLTRMFRPMKDGQGPAPLRMQDLPPLPADLTRFAAVRWDVGAAFELLHLFDLDGALNNEVDKGLTAEQRLKEHREKFLGDVNDLAGIKMAELFSALEDRVVTYQAPSDGIFNIGQVVAIGIRDEKTLRRCLEALGKRLETTSSKQIAIQRRDCLGVQVHEFVVKRGSPVTIAYAICDGWLVIGFQPQPVRGFIYRAKGKLPVWKPDARTAASLAKVPDDRCVLQVADPRPTLQWLLGIAPVVAGLVAEDNHGPHVEAGLIPHAGEINQHLFPNLMWCRDDGKTMRWESRDSLWLPLEAIGMELIGAFSIAGPIGF